VPGDSVFCETVAVTVPGVLFAMVLDWVMESQLPPVTGVTAAE
jgi:hypothetical protein